MRNPDLGYFLMRSPLGSSRRMARNAVGAVKSAFTPWSEMTPKKAPGSGVETGFPS